MRIGIFGMLVVAACGGKIDGQAYGPQDQAAVTSSECCAAPPNARACLDVPDSAHVDGPQCEPFSVDDPVRFDTRGELEDFLRGHWMLCASSHFPPGAYSPLTGLAFAGEGDAFSIAAITWDAGGNDCTYVNDEKYYAVKSFSMLRVQEAQQDWVVRFEMAGMQPLAIAAIAESPRRMRLENGAVLVHFP